MAGYCEASDLLLGDIPLPSYMSAQKQVDDARDEIDSKIGYLYKTPVDVTATELARPAQLLLKRINAALATGRLLLALASPEENKNLHAYGWSLVREANTALDAIAKGVTVLEGAEPAENMPPPEPVAVPLIDNLDPESNVEAFYNRVSNPYYKYFGLDRYSDPDRLVY